MFTAAITALVMALSGITGNGGGAVVNEAYPICEDWQTSSASDGCANPTGRGITINGERLVNCSFGFPGKCFNLTGLHDGPLTYVVHVNR